MTEDRQLDAEAVRRQDPVLVLSNSWTQRFGFRSRTHVPYSELNSTD